MAELAREQDENDTKAKRIAMRENFLFRIIPCYYFSNPVDELIT